jgi:hypothetical protein
MLIVVRCSNARSARSLSPKPILSDALTIARLQLRRPHRASVSGTAPSAHLGAFLAFTADSAMLDGRLDC